MRSNSPLLFGDAKKNLDFEVLDKNAPEYIKKIDKSELRLLIHMLEDLNHPSLEDSKKAYGYPENSQDPWNEDQLTVYKDERLKKRIEDEGYTFYRLGNLRPIAVASGNVYENSGTRLRILNFVVDRDFRRQGNGLALLTNIIKDCQKKDIVEISFLISPYAQRAGMQFYRYLINEFGLQGTLPDAPTDKAHIFKISQIEFSHFLSANEEKKSMSQKPDNLVSFDL